MTPSPTIATTRPSLWSRRTTLALSAGSTSAITSSIPTLAATASAVWRLSPVRSTGRSPSSWSRRIASGELGLIVSATTRIALTSPSQPAAIAVRPSLSAACLAARSEKRRTTSKAPVLEQPEPAGDYEPALDHALDPEALVVAEVGDGRQRLPTPLPRRSRRSRGRSGARRRPRARRRRARPRRGRRAGWRGSTACMLISPLGHGPGLVEHDRVDATRRFEHLGALDQQAELGAAAGPDQQRRRRRQAERAGAGDGSARRRRP